MTPAIKAASDVVKIFEGIFLNHTSQKCPACKGFKKMPRRFWGFRSCDTCKGTGYMPLPSPVNLGMRGTELMRIVVRALERGVERDKVLADLGYRVEQPGHERTRHTDGYHEKWLRN